MNPALQEANKLFIISGPAGSGKTTLCDTMLLELSPKVQRVITVTTRLPRQGEHNGKDFIFLSQQAFEEQIKQGAFYEFAQVHGNWYGTPKAMVQEPLKRGHDLLLNIDVQGAESFRKVALSDVWLQKHLVSIFILPENLETLKERLQKRGSETPESLEKRLKTAIQELDCWPAYDYCLPSTTKEEDFARLLSIYAAEKMRKQ